MRRLVQEFLPKQERRGERYGTQRAICEIRQIPTASQSR